MAKREFTLEDEHTYNRSTTVRWITSHMMRYPAVPLLMVAAAVVNNLAYGNIQIYVGRAFDLISQPTWLAATLLVVAAGVVGSAVVQGLTGLARNFSVDYGAAHRARCA